MHYKNGREAKIGDKVVRLPKTQYEVALAGGLLYATSNATTCNGQVAPTGVLIISVTLSECLHEDDFREMINATPPTTPPTD